MGNSVGTFKAGSVISHVEARLKKYTNEIIPRELWLDLINIKSAMVHEALANKDKAIYKDSIILTDPGVSLGGIVPIGQSCTYTNSTKTLHVPNNAFAAYFSTSATNFNSVPVGSLVLLIDYNDRANNSYLLTKIKSITGINDVVLEDAYGTDITHTRLMFSLSIPNTTDNILLSLLSVYKQIDQITSIYSNVIAADCREMQSINHFFNAKQTHMAYNFKNQIIWSRDGEFLRFAKGTSVAGYGTRTLYFTRKPYPVTAVTDLVDIPDANMDILIKALLLDGLQSFNEQIPSDLQLAQNQVNQFLSAKEKEIVDKEIVKKDN